MQSYHDNLILQFDDGTTGNAASGQLVTVFNAGLATKPAIFDTLGSPIANPLTTDIKGNFSFTIPDGVYDIVGRAGTPDETRRDQVTIAVPAGLDLINDLSQAYEFATVALFKSSAIAFPVGKPLYIKELTTSNGGGEIYYIALTSTVTPDNIDVFQSTAVPTQSAVKAEYGQISGKVNKKYIKFSGVLRNTGSGWFFITDSAHQNINFLSVVTNVDGTVTLNLPANLKTIGNVTITPDETYSRIGIVAGCSVGLTEIIIHFSAPLNARIDTTQTPPTVFTPNHFLTGGNGASRFTAQINTGNIALNHAAKSNGSNISAIMQTSSPKHFMNIGVSFIDNSTTAFFLTKDIYGFAFYDGADWQLLSEKGNVSPVWDNTNKRLELIHARAPALLGRQTTGRHPYHAMLDSTSDTSTFVKFVDLAGTDIVVEDTNMRFHYLIKEVTPITAGVLTEDVGNIIVTGDNVKVMAQDLTQTAGNFWIEGIFEI